MAANILDGVGAAAVNLRQAYINSNRNRLIFAMRISPLDRNEGSGGGITRTVMQINLRLAGIQDAGLLMEFIKAYYTFDEIPLDPERIRPALEELLSGDSLGRAWLIETEGNDAGYLLATFGYDLEFGGRIATITEFYIQPEYRRGGLGTQTIEFVEKTLRASGVKTLELQVERTNRKALLFYTKNGFRGHDRIPLSKPITGLS